MDKSEATTYPLDIPHVTAVELPLNVKNTTRAVEMLGGQDRVRMAINAQFRPLPLQPSSHSVDERNLELRLRKDPFHHPVQASVNRREKVLVKVSVPKSSLPADYFENREKYTIRELVARSRAQGGVEPKVEPVAVVNKNYNFRAMADFQMTTKNNPSVQKFKQEVLGSTKFDDTKAYYENTLTNKDEYKNSENYDNRDHQLVPPPHFLGVRFPFDYKYKKNVFTAAIRDENGDVKVVMKTDSKKLFTNTVNYHNGTVPQQPLPEIVAKYTWLKNTDLSGEWADKKLLECIECLSELFALKPVWLRRMIIELVPPRLALAVKEALPYVSYCYKNGPWRFCNVRLGVDPTSDREYWQYQSEYFRLGGLTTKPQTGESSRKILPPTLARTHPESDLRVCESMFFTGNSLPRTYNYQLGDILDADVQRVVDAQKSKGDAAFFRSSPDPLDGWITSQMMGTIRGIVKYKLRRLQAEEAVDPADIARIIDTDYTLKGVTANVPEEEEDEDDEEDDEDENATPEGGEEVGDADEDAAERHFDALVPSVSEDYVMNRVKQVDEKTAAKLLSLVGLIKQDALNNAARE